MSKQDENINLNILLFLNVLVISETINYIKVNFFCREFLPYIFKFVSPSRRSQTILVILSASNKQKNQTPGLHFLVPNTFLLNQPYVNRQFKQINS